MVADFKTSTSLTGRILASAQLTATTSTTAYTVPAASAVKVASFSITNTTSAAASITVNVVPSGGTLGTANVILNTYTVAANDVITHKDVLSALDGAFLDTGTVIALTAGTANALNYLITGAVSA